MKNFLFIILAFIFICASGPKLTTRKITEGVTAGLPKDFVEMSEGDIAFKYPSTKKPLSMWTSLDRTVDFGLNVSKSSWAGGDMAVLKDIYKATILDLYSNVTFLTEGVEKINGRDFVVFEFISESTGTKAYTYVSYTVIGQRVYIFNFSTGGEKKDKWRETAKAIIHSVNINPAKLKEVVEEYQPVHKGKRPIQVIKEKPAPNSNKKK